MIGGGDMLQKLNDYELAIIIARHVKELGGNVYFVGDM